MKDRDIEAYIRVRNASIFVEDSCDVMFAKENIEHLSKDQADWVERIDMCFAEDSLKMGKYDSQMLRRINSRLYRKGIMLSVEAEAAIKRDIFKLIKFEHVSVLQN